MGITGSLVKLEEELRIVIHRLGDNPQVVVPLSLLRELKACVDVLEPTRSNEEKFIQDWLRKVSQRVSKTEFTLLAYLAHQDKPTNNTILKKALKINSNRGLWTLISKVRRKLALANLGDIQTIYGGGYYLTFHGLDRNISHFQDPWGTKDEQLESKLR